MEISARQWSHLQSPGFKRVADELLDEVKQFLQGEKFFVEGQMAKNIATLLENFATGMRFALSGKRTALDKPPIDIGSHIQLTLSGSGYAYEAKENRILMQRLMLENNALKQIHESEKIMHGKHVGFVGTTAQRLLLAGVEEGDHAFFFGQRSAITGITPIQNGYSLAQYDNQPWELQSLHKRLEAARYFNLPEKVQKVIRDRIRAAEKIS